jgi:hypothetical protein
MAKSDQFTSPHKRMSENRNFAIDLFRGIVICDMIVMHFAGFFPGQIALLTGAFDFAIEGFLLLSGFMIARHYLPRFVEDRVGVSKKLLLRSFKIVCIQYLLVITVSLPFYVCFGPVTREEIVDFALSSFLFLNQIPIIHILPIFIPLFLISPLILQILAKGGEWWLLSGSVGAFVLGCKYPYVFTFGERPIFPVVLWQIYFICGCVIGKVRAKSELVNPMKLLAFAAPVFAVCLLMKYGSYFELLRSLKVTFDIYPKKFPLNVCGLAYGGSLVFFAYALLLAAWAQAKARSPFYDGLALLGRHSLAVFVIQAYVVYLLRAATTVSSGKLLAYVGVVGSFVLIYLSAAMIDKKSQAGRMPRIYRLLFA